MCRDETGKMVIYDPVHLKELQELNKEIWLVQVKKQCQEAQMQVAKKHMEALKKRYSFQVDSDTETEDRAEPPTDGKNDDKPEKHRQGRTKTESDDGAVVLV